MKPSVSIFWLRRDLRLCDNAGLYHALKSGTPVLPLFIFDKNILNALPDRSDARVSFIHQTIKNLHQELSELGCTLLTYYDTPERAWADILQRYNVQAAYTNADHEPYALRRDAAVEQLLAANAIRLHRYKDHIIFGKDEVLKDDGAPYTVFTPYSRKWLAKLQSRISRQDGEPVSCFLKSYPNERYFRHFAQLSPLPLPALEDMGFSETALSFPPATVRQGLIRHYDSTRNFPAKDGTSRLGLHFRFGTISIREKARHALTLNATYLNELIWRDFYSQILAHFPHVADRAFKPQYDLIPWRNAPDELEKWKAGRTGYPIGDAGMRELAATGYMHNRVRMITASFLTKHLLADWRLGEAWFAEKLLDYDLASNSGGWQWAAGCGTDAAPYFRIFNPTEQTKKFDPDYQYIRKWVPEFGTPSYPRPMVDHAFARARCLEVYKSALAREA